MSASEVSGKIILNNKSEGALSSGGSGVLETDGRMEIERRIRTHARSAGGVQPKVQSRFSLL